MIKRQNHTKNLKIKTFQIATGKIKNMLKKQNLIFCYSWRYFKFKKINKIKV